MPEKEARRSSATREIRFGFDANCITLKLGQIVPLKMVTDAVRESRKFKQILTSIREVGVIEPPVVSRDRSTKSRFILLDGHLRVEALKQLNIAEVLCLVSTDDESFTYNRQISRLSAIQEHRMIAKAVERGVSEEKIARTLDVNIRNIIMKKNLLEGICPEVIDLLKDKMVSNPVFIILRKMTPTRQIEAASLMNDAGIYTGSYANALLAASPKNQLTAPDMPKKVRGLTEEQMSRMEDEMATLQREYRLIEESYGSDVLNLTLAKGYLASLLGNAKVVRFLAQNHSEFLSQFQKIAEMTSLSEKNAVT